jgi:hypothetical protein
MSRRTVQIPRKFSHQKINSYFHEIHTKLDSLKINNGIQDSLISIFHKHARIRCFVNRKIECYVGKLLEIQGDIEKINDFLVSILPLRQVDLNDARITIETIEINLNYIEMIEAENNKNLLNNQILNLVSKINMFKRYHKHNLTNIDKNRRIYKVCGTIYAVLSSAIGFTIAFWAGENVKNPKSSRYTESVFFAAVIVGLIAYLGIHFYLVYQKKSNENNYIGLQKLDSNVQVFKDSSKKVIEQLSILKAKSTIAKKMLQEVKILFLDGTRRKDNDGLVLQLRTQNNELIDISKHLLKNFNEVFF